MKKNLKIFLMLYFCFSLLTSELFADYTVTIYSPEGKPVSNVLVRDEASPDQISRWNSETDSWIGYYGLTAVRIGSASRTYNCHGYAWLLSEDHGTYWMNSSERDQYINDGSYSNDGLPSYISSSESNATHSAYLEEDHSARRIQNSYPVAISGSMEYVSKWGSLGLVQHAKNNDVYYIKSNKSHDFRVLKTTHCGTLTNYPKFWIGAAGKVHTLSGTTYVTNTLTIESGASVNMGTYPIILTGGTVINQGTLNCTYLKQSDGSILGFYPTIQAACNNVGSSQTVVLQTRTYNESVSLSGMSSIHISGYGATVNGHITLNNASYCTISGLHLNNGYQFFVNGGTNNNLTDSQSDKSTGVLNIYNSTACKILNFTATNGDPGEFAVNIYGSTGDMYSNSTIEHYACGVFADYNTNFNVNNNYFCHNAYDADAENGGYIRLSANTYSRINPTSVLGNCYGDEYTSQVCTNSSFAKAISTTPENSSSLTNSDNKMEQMYLELINKISKDELKDYSQLKDKYKPEYDKLIDILNGSLSTANSMSQQDKTLSLLSHCYKWLNEKETFYSIVDGLFNNKSFASNTARLKKYTIDKYIDFKDYKGAVETADAIIKGNSTDQNLTCEMLYEKGIIYKFYVNDNSSAYRAFSQIIDNYPKHNLAKFAKGQIDNLPKDVDKNYLKST
ncbi:MAG: tetratricopeptide repeat protein, partial [Clostridiales bacterium]